jgi:molybdopterin molybdotransferase
MLGLEEAQQKIIGQIQPLGAEAVPLASSYGRILVETILSPVDLPPLDNSAMDGYAVRSADLTGASAQAPARLQVTGRVAAGGIFSGTVQPGTCVRLFTGSALPEGADAVVMQEDVRRDASQPEEAVFVEPVRPWENIRFRGEDLKKGFIVAQPGQRINTGRLALIAAAGCGHVQAGVQPQAALLATGSELREPGEPLDPGTIFESNRVALAAMVAGAGGVPRVYPLVEDDLGKTEEALRRAFDECDLVITSGGVSVGEFDFVKEAFERMGGELSFWRVSIKPGKPLVMGKWNGKCLFGLPGNPVSALVTFHLLVRPALIRLQGGTEFVPAMHPGVLAEPLSNSGGRRHFMRVTVDESGRVRSAGGQASHMLRALADSNGLVDVPPETRLEAGSPVSVIRWD